MQRSVPRAARRGRPRFTIIVMTLLSVTVLTLDAKDVPVLSQMREGAAAVLSPIEGAFGSVTRPLRNAWGGVTRYEAVQKENRKLRSEIEALRGRAISESDAQSQVEQLKAQLDIPFATDFQKVVAQIATGNFSSFDDNTAQIDKGSDSGIKVGMPVVTPSGVAGRIERVTANRSTVRLLTDPDLRLGIRLSNDSLGVGRGTGAGRPFLVDEGIGLSVPVKIGDPVMTSGQERAVMPRGLPIGTVKKITRVQSDQTQVLEVRLAADLSRLDYVQVLIWEPQP